MDERLRVLDGMFNYVNLGVNVVLGVFMVLVRVSVKVLNLLLYCYLGGVNVLILFVLMFNIINGGMYVNNFIDF